KPHRGPRHRLADRRCVVRVVLAALEIGLHIAWRHQPYRVTERLQCAAPVMRRWTSLNPHQARRKGSKKLQYFRATDAPADYNRTSIIDPMYLKDGLRDIKTERANVAHRTAPLNVVRFTQPPYGTSMPQSGRRPQHQ